MDDLPTTFVLFMYDVFKKGEDEPLHYMATTLNYQFSFRERMEIKHFPDDIQLGDNLNPTEDVKYSKIEEIIRRNVGKGVLPRYIDPPKDIDKITEKKATYQKD